MKQINLPRRSSGTAATHTLCVSEADPNRTKRFSLQEALFLIASPFRKLLGVMPVATLFESNFQKPGF